MFPSVSLLCIAGEAEAEVTLPGPGRLLELEHGILDIVEAGARLWLQAGHSEKAVALYQALLETMKRGKRPGSSAQVGTTAR